MAAAALLRLLLNRVAASERNSQNYDSSSTYLIFELWPGSNGAVFERTPVLVNETAVARNMAWYRLLHSRKHAQMLSEGLLKQLLSLSKESTACEG